MVDAVILAEGAEAPEPFFLKVTDPAPVAELTVTYVEIFLAVQLSTTAILVLDSVVVG